MTISYYPAADIAAARTFSTTVRSRIVPSPPGGTLTTMEFPIGVSRDGDGVAYVNDQTNLVSGEISSLVSSLGSYPGGWSAPYIPETVFARSGMQEFRLYIAGAGLRTLDWCKELSLSPAGILYESDVRVDGTATEFYASAGPHDVPSTADLVWSIQNYFTGHPMMASDADALRAPLLLIDIERYKTRTINSGDLAAAGVSTSAEYRALSNAAISTLIDRLNAAAPRARVSNYGLYLPQRDWFGSLPTPDPAWTAINDEQAVIVNKFDIITPSLYMMVDLGADYADTSGNRSDYGTYITHHLDEMQRVAPTKKVIPYIWNGSRNTGTDYLMSQACYEVGLRACFAHPHCAGAILWNKASDSSHMTSRTSSTQLALRAFLANPTGV